MGVAAVEPYYDLQVIVLIRRAIVMSDIVRVVSNVRDP
jgi:hypothetical protein